MMDTNGLGLPEEAHGIPAKARRYAEEYGKALAAMDASDAVIRAVMAGEKTIDDYVAYRRSKLGEQSDEQIDNFERLCQERHGRSLDEGFREDFERRRAMIGAADRATPQDVLDIITAAKHLIDRCSNYPGLQDTVREVQARLTRIGA